MHNSRGLAALILSLFFFSSILQADYLYKDEITHNKKLKEEINLLGDELYKATGISVRLIMIKKLPKNTTIVEYEKEIMKNFDTPTVLLTFSREDKKVDILASNHSLYKYFDKKQILSPVASIVQSFFMAVFFTHSWDEFKTTLNDYGGSIIPLLAQKAKKENDKIKKYSAAMFNGYADLVSQIAASKGVKLKDDVGNSNKYAIYAVKLFFYGFILYAIFRYIKLQFRRKKDD